MNKIRFFVSITVITTAVGGLFSTSLFSADEKKGGGLYDYYTSQGSSQSKGQPSDSNSFYSTSNYTPTFIQQPTRVKIFWVPAGREEIEKTESEIQKFLSGESGQKNIIKWDLVATVGGYVIVYHYNELFPIPSKKQGVRK